MLALEIGTHSYPVCTFSSHGREKLDAIHEHRKRVASYPPESEAASWKHRRGVVRAARAVVGRSLHPHVGELLLRREHQQRRRNFDCLVAQKSQRSANGVGDVQQGEVDLLRQQDVSFKILFADHFRSGRRVEQDVFELLSISTPPASDIARPAPPGRSASLPPQAQRTWMRQSATRTKSRRAKPEQSTDESCV